jgi:putative membrane protein insertion efficiency factor
VGIRMPMPWIRRRRYDPYYDPYYDPRRTRGGYGYGGGYGNNSCLRDACLLETGCCLAEGLDGNCLMLALPLLPRFFATFSTGLLGGREPRQPGAVARAVLASIRVYQRDVSAHRPACCRFTPSCSEYAAQAVSQRGALRGTLLAARRLLRCRPGGNRGADPLPA